MGQDRQPPGAVDQADGRFLAELFLVGISRLAPSQIAVEGILDAGGIPLAHQQPGDVRAADCPRSRLGAQFTYRDLDSQPLQLFHDALTAAFTLSGKPGEGRAQFPGFRIDQQAQHMQVPARGHLGIHAQLHPRHHRQTVLPAGAQQLGDSLHRIMVGQGNSLQPQRPGLRHQRSGRVGAVGEGAMSVEVDHDYVD